MSISYKVDLTGQRFGRLVALRHEPTPGNKTFWLCKCDCGKEVLVGYGELRTGNTKSCGCFHRDSAADRLRKQGTRHGMFGTRIYNIWWCMKDRCYNKNHMAYKNYGGRGITVCDEWKNNFEPFYRWAMNSGYRKDLTIDRIDVNGNYEPHNCRWVTLSEQANNKRNTIYLTVHGETKTVAEWSKETGLSRATIRSRIKSGWTEEKILIPLTRRKARKET